MKLEKKHLIELAASCQRISFFMGDAWAARNTFSGRYDDLGELCFIDLLLDIMGMPEDNTQESNSCAYANETGQWPDWGFCRDTWYDSLGNMTAEEFVNDNLTYISKITKEAWDMYNKAKRGEYDWQYEAMRYEATIQLNNKALNIKKK